MIKSTLQYIWGNDLEVVKAAKVSFDRDEGVEFILNAIVSVDGKSYEVPHLNESQVNLIKFLARGMSRKDMDSLINEIIIGGYKGNDVTKLLWKFRTTPTHAAPFGHSGLSFVCESPVFVTRQMVKHEYLRLSEVSRRYVQGSVLYFQPSCWLSLAQEVKQGSGEPLSAIDNALVHQKVNQQLTEVDRLYEELSRIVSPEEARMILPLCHMTRWRWTGSLDAFMNMCNLRLDAHTQSHTHQLAQDIGNKIKLLFPHSYSAYVEGNV